MPPIYLYIELNCFAIAILLVIAWNIYSKQGHHSFDQKLFLMLLSSNILLLLFDMILWTADGRPGNNIRLLLISAIVLYNILNAIICMVWYYYVDYYVYGDRRRINNVLLPILIPVILNTFLSVASIFSNIYFIFDENNVYYRGRFIFILLALCLYMIIYTSGFLVKNREKVTKNDLAYLLFFPVLPAAGGIIQFLIPGTSVIWVTVTLAIFIIFINIQKEQMNTDYLTGVNNRRYLAEFMQTIKKDLGEPIAGIMIDIDDFKRINDEYGHDQGDQALKYTAQILKDTFRKTDFIARYGGDEFVVVMKMEKLSELDIMVQRLNENVSLFNAQKLTPYEIKLSIGYSFYKKESETSMDEFLQKIDHLMYMDKHRTE